jgi:hypothetical protein
MTRPRLDWTGWFLALLGALALLVAVSADGQTTASYPEVQPDSTQRALLRSIGPVECGPPIGLKFATLEGFQQWLWPQLVVNGKGAWGIGPSKISSTDLYITMTPELLDAARDRFDRHLRRPEARP